MLVVSSKPRARNERFIEQAKKAIELFSKQEPGLVAVLVPSESSIANGTPTWSWRFECVYGTFDLTLAFAEATANVFIFATSSQGVPLQATKRPYSLRAISPQELAQKMSETKRYAISGLRPKLVA